MQKLATQKILLISTLASILFVQSVFSAPTRVTADTQWGDIVPTNSIATTLTQAGFATTGYVHAVAMEALVALTNDFAANFMPLAAPIITNVVEDVLAPRTVAWHFDSSNVTDVAIMPNWATSRIDIDINTNWVEAAEKIEGSLYASGKLRNYSMVIDSYPANIPWLAFCVDANIATNAAYTIYASPAMRDLRQEIGQNDAYLGWNLTSNDVPCVITVRQPDQTTLIFRRDRLNDDGAYIQVENGEPVLYTE